MSIEKIYKWNLSTINCNHMLYDKKYIKYL